MKVSPDYISKLDSTEKHDSNLYMKKGESFQNMRISFFSSRQSKVDTRLPPFRAHATDNEKKSIVKANIEFC